MSYPIYDVRTGRRLTLGPTTGAYGDTYGYPIFDGAEFHHVLKWIRSRNFHVYANSHYGGINYSAHSPKSWHYVKDGYGRSLGADIGTFGDVNERTRLINELIPALDRIGMGWHYARNGAVPGHYDHLHVDVSHWGRKGGAAPNYGFYTTAKKLNVYTALPLSGGTVPVITTNTILPKRAPRRISLAVGSTGSLVKIVQRIARTTVDGSYGRGTAAAVKALQGRLGVSQDGNFGPNTARAYLASIGTRSVGSTGWSVQLIQWVANIGIDGQYGPATVRAVKEMQTWAGIYAPSGSFGPESRQRLIR